MEKFKEKFKEWFKNNLVVSRFPLPGEIIKSNFDVIINVSDEFITYCFDAAIQSNKRYFWFPMSECNENMGIHSIYGALQILHLSYVKGHKVLLHCHAGANRSVTVSELFYYMFTNEFRKLKITVKVNGFDSDNIPELSMLELNIKHKHLPFNKQEMEKFLSDCKRAFEKEETMRGGGLERAVRFKESVS